MPVLKWKLLVLGFIFFCGKPLSRGESSTCLTLYKEGGAPAVFQSPKCPLWKPSRSRTTATTGTGTRCQSAMLQGRRKTQEDRTLCALNLHIPFPGTAGPKDVKVGIVAVFDGHNGAEASEMTSKLLLEYFSLHAYFLLDATYSIVSGKSERLPIRGEQDTVLKLLHCNEEFCRHKLNLERYGFQLQGTDLDDSFYLEILKEALLRAIHDIDATFSKEASRNNLDSGSTATITMMADGQILVANIGDSKAFLCSEELVTPMRAKAALSRRYREQRRKHDVSLARDYYDAKLESTNSLAHFIVKELTRDHHPDRDDEKYRVEAAGGYVLEWGGVPRVNGQLAVSRAIGDVSYKRYGVISAPELTDWQLLSSNDSYLVVASDGLFEKLSLQDVCDILWGVHNHGAMKSGISSSCSFSLADCLVKAAFDQGSMDNVAAVVVPLEFTDVSQKQLGRRSGGEGVVDCPFTGLSEFFLKANDSTSNLVQLDNSHFLTTKFDRLLVEGKCSRIGCFHLSEILNGNENYELHAEENDQEKYVNDIPQALPVGVDYFRGGPLNLYDGKKCWSSWMNLDGAKDQCMNPEGLASFLGLLESIPFLGADFNNGSSGYAMPDMRYVLKKRFGRGSYGEVWVAFHWNCRQEKNSSTWSDKINNSSFDFVHLDPNVNVSCGKTSSHAHSDGSLDDDLFVLKRIMVERGTAVYLSGLREKYFGEVFSNASTHLQGLLSDSFFEESSSIFNDSLKRSESILQELENDWSFWSSFPNNSELQRVASEEGLNHIVRYVESFESRSNEIWLVFRHEGLSLSKLMYTTEEATIDPYGEKREELKNAQVLQPSKWWHWLKTTEAGQEEMRNLIWQLLMALKSCHDRNITHRDIKPENMVVCFEDQDSRRCLKGIPGGGKNFTTTMRIIDFGSAIDEFTLKHLYGSSGPSRAEQTHEYAAPEAFLSASWYQGPTSKTLKYDMWSVGVVMLEMIVGSPSVFQISALTRALLDHHLEGWSESLKELAYKSFMELCILIPGSSPKQHQTLNQSGVWPASWKCSEEYFSNQIKIRDPLKLGFPNVWALRLVRQLLQWHPEDRLSVDDALKHPYFYNPPRR